MNGRCWIQAPRCGYQGNGVGRHHLLGRDETGAYVQPELLVALCQPDCHQAGVHRLLGLADLDGNREPTPALILRRLAINLRWLAWHEPVPASGTLLDTWPALIRAVAEQLDVIGRELEGGQ